MTYARRQSPERRPVLTAAAARPMWAEALRLSDAICKAAIRAGEGADEATIRQPGQDLSRLMVALRDLAPENFPVNTGACRAMAGAYLHLARFLVLPSTGPEARTACARFMAPGVEELDAAVSLLRTEEAKGWRVQLGERGDD